MRKIFIVLLLPLLLASCLGDKEMKTSVEEQANELGGFLRRASFNLYLERMAPFVYSNNAERDQLKKQLEEQRAQLYARDHSEIKATQAHLSSDIYENEGYYQCIVRQETLVKTDLTSYSTNYWLLAISEDGEEWKFADITHFSEDMVRAVFPELHSKLKTDKIKRETPVE